MAGRWHSTAAALFAAGICAAVVWLVLVLVLGLAYAFPEPFLTGLAFLAAAVCVRVVVVLANRQDEPSSINAPAPDDDERR